MNLNHSFNSFIWQRIPIKIKYRMGELLNDIIISPDYIQSLLTKDGITIIPEYSGMFGAHIWIEYKFDDIQKDDIVIDLGANVGAFSLRAAKLSDHVHAIEPLWTDILLKNISLNPSLKDKITVHNVAIGDGKPIFLKFNERERVVNTTTLGNLIKEVGGCDFLKSDIEGAEYLIPLDEFKGIRRIEMERHNHKGTIFTVNPQLKKFLLDNWDCQIDNKFPYIGDEGDYIHCYPK